MDLGLDGKRAVVTGGSRGIGKAIARALASEGCTVAIAARDPERLAAAAKEIEAETGQTIIPLQFEAAEDSSVAAMIAKAAESLGGIDILVNDAAVPGGTNPPPKLAEVTTEEFAGDMNVKVMGYLRAAQHAAPIIAAGGWGRIVNVGGLAARSTGSLLSSMRTVATASLTKNLADELGPLGINVNLVHPGLTFTERITPERAAQPATNVIGRMVDASEVADLVAFLCSPRSVSITGESIACGGGAKGAIYY
jgi:NAD(P)-dependent dehydrogenase (short-subunit alcohol dehydrogenase family)